MQFENLLGGFVGEYVRIFFILFIPSCAVGTNKQFSVQHNYLIY